jgi:hypothetical protein
MIGLSRTRTAARAAQGGEFYYKLTQSLTGTVTINPDFSDAPLDERLVNTTRFSLFIPRAATSSCRTHPPSNLAGTRMPTALIATTPPTRSLSFRAISDWSRECP